jgi:hypothetical protein
MGREGFSGKIAHKNCFAIQIFNLNLQWDMDEMDCFWFVKPNVLPKI